MSARTTFESRAQARRSAERFLFAKTRDAPLRVCLLYANHYPVAMGNLGFQSVFATFDGTDGVVCERAFLPESDVAADVGAGRLTSLESGRRLADFDLLAFSISFETDYLNVPAMLRFAGLPARSAERDGGAPLVIAGGPAIFLNPEPIADFVDLFLIGEAEEMLPEFLAVVAAAAQQPRSALLAEAERRVAGTYVPRHHELRFDGASLLERRHVGGAAAVVERRLLWDLNRFATTTRVLADEAVFGDMVMVEASRGCQWGCRFCAAGFMYRPIRTRDPESLGREVATGLGERATIGLVGAEMASVPGVAALSAQAAAAGGRLSPSSLKADCVTPTLAAALATGGTRSATVAPEAGSERMRRAINKNLSESDILRAADLLVGEGVDHLKLYFMIGLPTEEDEDVLAIAQLTERIRERLEEGARGRGRVGRVTVSLNPFVPKPWTPFQWEPMESIARLRAKVRLLRRACARIPNLSLDCDSPREAYLQTLLSRGDRRVAAIIEEIDGRGGDWWGVLRDWQRRGRPGLPPPDDYVHRPYDAAEILPWDFIDHRIGKDYLWIERRKALSARQTAPCDTATCRACAAC